MAKFPIVINLALVYTTKVGYQQENSGEIHTWHSSQSIMRTVSYPEVQTHCEGSFQIKSWWYFGNDHEKVSSMKNKKIKVRGWKNLTKILRIYRIHLHPFISTKIPSFVKGDFNNWLTISKLTWFLSKVYMRWGY